MLITQTQFQPMTASDTSIDLTYFNHPVKAVHIAAFGTGATHTFDSASMYINGTPLFENMSQEYHRIVVPDRHCSVLSEGGDDMPITTWPFCLTMNKSQPTGTLNFSRIDSAKITISILLGELIVTLFARMRSTITFSGLRMVWVVSHSVINVLFNQKNQILY